MLTDMPSHEIKKELAVFLDAGGFHLGRIFREHEILSSLSVIWLIYIKLYKEKEKKWQKFWAKWESSLTTVQLKWDPPVS